MLIISFYISVIQILIVYSIFELNIPNKSTDCFESIHDSSIQVMVSSQYSTNPKFLQATFFFEVYPHLPLTPPRCEDYTYALKKIGGKCSTSLTVSTTKNPYRKMRIFIEVTHIYHLHDEKIAEMAVTIFPGFKPGIYPLVDKNGKFSIEVNIINSGLNIYTYEENRTYLNAKPVLETLKYTGGEICIVTENEIPIVLRPVFPNSQPSDYITKVEVVYIRNGYPVPLSNFLAFECHTDHIDPHSSIFLLKDETIAHGLQFRLIHVTFTQSFHVEKSVVFTVDDILVDNVQNYRNIPPEMNKLFLMNKQIKKMFCPDETERVIHILDDGTRISAKEIRNEMVFSFIKQWQWISRNPLSPCDA